MFSIMLWNLFLNLHGDEQIPCTQGTFLILKLVHDAENGTGLAA